MHVLRLGKAWLREFRWLLLLEGGGYNLGLEGVCREAFVTGVLGCIRLGLGYLTFVTSGMCMLRIAWDCMEPFGAMRIDYYESNEHEMLCILMRLIASQLKKKRNLLSSLVLFTVQLSHPPQDSLSCVTNLLNNQSGENSTTIQVYPDMTSIQRSDITNGTPAQIINVEALSIHGHIPVANQQILAFPRQLKGTILALYKIEYFCIGGTFLEDRSRKKYDRWSSWR